MKVDKKYEMFLEELNNVVNDEKVSGLALLFSARVPHKEHNDFSSGVMMLDVEFPDFFRQMFLVYLETQALTQKLSNAEAYALVDKIMCDVKREIFEMDAHRERVNSGSEAMDKLKRLFENLESTEKRE